jgi:acetyl esterase/lipase
VRKLVVILLAIVVVAGAGCGQSEPAPESHPRPVLLLLHGGAFLYGSPSMMRLAARRASAEGFKAVAVDYRLGDLSAAIADSVRVARRYGRNRPVYAYGESAGGTLAGLLAERGLVKAAVAYAPASDLTHFTTAYARSVLAKLGASRRELALASPALHRSRMSILALVPARDEIIPPGQTAAWARRDPRVEAITVPGPHSYSRYYEANMRQGIDHLAALARR